MKVSPEGGYSNLALGEPAEPLVQPFRFLWWLLMLFACPFRLVYHAVRIFVMPCMWSYIEAATVGVYHKICAVFCCDICHKYTDRFFLQGFAAPNAVKWIRASEIAAPNQKPWCLFAGDIEPSDIAQGGLGNCWLLASFAVAAESRGLIQSMFKQREISPRGCYEIRLFHPLKREFVNVTIDDYIPCNAAGRPMYSQPHNNELWVLLLEKAFAKLCGSYNVLEGGWMMWAMHVLTGDYVCEWRLQDAVWQRQEGRVTYDAPTPCGFCVPDECFPLIPPTFCNRANFAFAGAPDQRRYMSEELFDLIASYLARGSLVCAATKEDASASVVGGHAFSVLEAVDCGGAFKMLKLRNPWGTDTFRGDFSAGSRAWLEHPLVNLKCLGATGDSKQLGAGILWMKLADFVQSYNCVQLCVKSTGIQDVAMDIHEERGCIGPLCGCAGGLFRYFFLCQGARALCCNRDTSKDIREDPNLCGVYCHRG